MFQRGQIVLAKAGKEKGSFLIVLKQEGRMLYLADGKQRTISRPKLKNKAHAAKTRRIVPEEELETDKKIRTALRNFRNADQLEG